MSYKPEVGDRVNYNGYTQEQVKWGNNDCPYMLIVGREYIVTAVERHSSHTKVCVRGVAESLRFNSVHFTLSRGSVTL